MPIDGVRWDILCHTGQRLDECRTADRHSAADHATRGDPSAVVDFYRTCNKAHVAPVVVAACCYERLLGYHSIVADGHLVLVMNPNSLADPRPIANLQIPGELDAGTRSDDDLVTDLRAEGTERLRPQPGTDLPRVSHEHELSDRPQVNDPFRLVPGFAFSWSL